MVLAFLFGLYLLGAVPDADVFMAFVGLVWPCPDEVCLLGFQAFYLEFGLLGAFECLERALLDGGLLECVLSIVAGAFLDFLYCYFGAFLYRLEFFSRVGEEPVIQFAPLALQIGRASCRE